ncbi:unnamed protein product, partial [Oppiella nova]
MFRKCVNSQHFRLLAINNRHLSSQISVKTSEDVAKRSDGRAVSAAEGLQHKTLTQQERQELAKVIKSPVHMDSYWEMKLEEKIPQKVKMLDSKGGLSVDFLALMAHKFDFSLQGIKRRLRYWIAFREMYNQRYIARRHAILGPELAVSHFVVYRGGKVRFRRIYHSLN